MNGFIEVTTGNQIILHGFDKDNKEIIEEVKVSRPVKKTIAVSRIQSISERYIMATYAFGRLVYWEYEEDYNTVLERLKATQS